ncbi:hypothetical protein QUF64_06980 [Anaerolineales bacterium HSG6]|nr:hypothetical protein [Anaerolineales bacterium HSG6]MDM8532632.1 hypothetical protein [Anaerolineales bacterium HSG25]
MKLDITLCHSILAYCFANLDHYERQNRARYLLDEIRKRRINLNDDLQVYYEVYFETHHSDLLEDYQQWFANQVIYADYVTFVPNNLSNTEIDYFVNDDYLRTLLNITRLNQDKIVFSELLSSYDQALKNMGILQLNIAKILDRNANNYYNDYHFPITRKRIIAEQSSRKLSNWLKRIIQSETDFEIIDNYIYTERNNFKRYFLPHVQHGAVLKIYTISDQRVRVSVTDLIREFSSPDYANWQIELYLVQSTRHQHARNILTNNYFIQLEKGMRIFGRKGHTDQSDINVDYRKNITSTSMPRIHKRLI